MKVAPQAPLECGEMEVAPQAPLECVEMKVAPQAPLECVEMKVAPQAPLECVEMEVAPQAPLECVEMEVAPQAPLPLRTALKQKIPPDGGIFYWSARTNPASGRGGGCVLYSYCNFESFSFAFSTSELEGNVLTSLLYASLAAALSPSARYAFPIMSCA